jgi:hypothetical protein
MARKKKSDTTQEIGADLTSEVATEKEVVIMKEPLKHTLSLSEARGLVHDSDVPSTAVEITKEEYIKMHRQGTPVCMVTGATRLENKYFLLSKSKK